jgi:hypothetical protein
VVRQLMTTIRRALCYDEAISKGSRLTRDTSEVSHGPQALWLRNKQQVLQDVRSAKAVLDSLKLEVQKALVSIEDRLNKPSAKHQLELHVSNVMMDVEALIERCHQLTGIFDAWARYDELAAMQVDAAMPAVLEVLEDFDALTDVLTHNKTRSDVLDGIQKHDGFYYDVKMFHIGLVKLDERLWQALEQAVGASDSSDSTNVEASGNTVRPLSTSDALALMKKFESVSSRSDAAFVPQSSDAPGAEDTLDEATDAAGNCKDGQPSIIAAWKGAEKLYFSILRRLLESIREVQAEYNVHKHKPPSLRNVSPVMQHVLWAQQLQRKVQQNKRDLQTLPPGLKNARFFRKVMSMASNTEDTLSEYLSRWYEAWVETVQVTKTGLNATLLAQHPLTLKLSVNFDEGINELIHDAKGFKRNGFPLPQAAQKVLERELELNTYHAALKETMKKYHDSIHHIPLPLRPLLGAAVEDLEHKLEPARSTLTWMSVNIDAFLTSIEAGIANLNVVVHSASRILTKEIEGVLKRVKTSSLIDISSQNTYTLGSGGLETFVRDQCDIIKERSARIAADMRQAEEAVERLVALAPSPYAFHTDENHYERDLKMQLGYLAYQATRGCVAHTLDLLKQRLVAGPTGLFYITRPMFGT